MHHRRPGTQPGPEAVTYVRGSAELVNGKITIDLPKYFSDVTSDEGLTVQRSPVGRWLQLYISEQTPTHIVVGEATGQNSKFNYLINGVLKGYEDYQEVRDTAKTGIVFPSFELPTMPQTDMTPSAPGK